MKTLLKNALSFLTLKSLTLRSLSTKAFVIAAVACALLAPQMYADDDFMEQIVGDWVSPDGTARQHIQRQLDGSWLSVQMWFQVEGEWRESAYGGIYQKATAGKARNTWTSAVRTTHMQGFELFESTFEPDGETLKVKSRAYQADGTIFETAEEWRFPDQDRIDYVIFKLGETEPWMQGRWVRRKDT